MILLEIASLAFSMRPRLLASLFSLYLMYSFVYVPFPFSFLNKDIIHKKINK